MEGDVGIMRVSWYTIYIGGGFGYAVNIMSYIGYTQQDAFLEKNFIQFYFY
jgi:hypothetical protein